MREKSNFLLLFSLVKKSSFVDFIDKEKFQFYNDFTTD